MAVTTASIEQDVRQIISDVTGIPVSDLGADKNFYSELGVDSIKAIELVVAMEKRFKVRLRDEQVSSITTVGQAVLAVQKAAGAVI